jgi:hypothetical protein
MEAHNARKTKNADKFQKGAQPNGHDHQNA